jgi:hypothetical protein
MSEAGFHLDGYSVLRLTSTDASGLQDLFERCTDFHELSEGFPTRPTAGAEELVARPAGRDLVDKFSFGIYAPRSSPAHEAYRNAPLPIQHPLFGCRAGDRNSCLRPLASESTPLAATAVAMCRPNNRLQGTRGGA